MVGEACAYRDFLLRGFGIRGFGEVFGAVGLSRGWVGPLGRCGLGGLGRKGGESPSRFSRGIGAGKGGRTGGVARFDAS